MATGLNVHLDQLLYASNQVEAQPIRPVPMMATAMQRSSRSSPVSGASADL